MDTETKSLTSYITQSLDLALDSGDSETSYSNSFEVIIYNSGFAWVPRLPSAILINDDLYERIFEIASVALYPRYTLLKQNSSYMIPLNTDDIHIQRALFFPWIKGVPQRLLIDDLNTYLKVHDTSKEEIELMKGLSINYNKVTSVAIAGNSGSGKSYFLVYLLTVLREFSTLVVIDPKMDTPSRWSKKYGAKVIYPDSSRSKSDFITQVNDELLKALNLIHQRQNQLFTNEEITFKHYTVVIDEVLALSEGIPKKLKDIFFALLSQIALMGRATNVHLILVSQRLDYNSIPISVREQLNVLVQIGNINSKTTQFLFPDLNPSGIVIPEGKGTGLIQIIDSEHPYQVQPFLAPTYNLEGIKL